MIAADALVMDRLGSAESFSSSFINVHVYFENQCFVVIAIINSIIITTRYEAFFNTSSLCAPPLLFNVLRLDSKLEGAS